MDPESWPRISSYSRRYQSRSDVYHGEDFEAEEEQRPEYLCPFCAEDYDMVGLCCHIDEEHAVEANYGVCPVCAKKVGSDLIRHLTVQHANLLKVQRRRRCRRGGANFSFTNLRKELREGNVRSLLGGGSPFLVSSSRAEPDPLLSSFISNPPAVDEPSTVKPLSSVEGGSASKSPGHELADRAAQRTPPMSDEDLKEKAQRCEFVQGLLLSTFMDDNL